MILCLWSYTCPEAFSFGCTSCIKMGLCLSLFLFFPKICTPHPVPPQKRNAYLIAYLGGKKERKKKKRYFWRHHRGKPSLQNSLGISKATWNQLGFHGIISTHKGQCMNFCASHQLPSMPGDNCGETLLQNADGTLGGMCISHSTSVGAVMALWHWCGELFLLMKE